MTKMASPAGTSTRYVAIMCIRYAVEKWFVQCFTAEFFRKFGRSGIVL